MKNIYECVQLIGPIPVTRFVVGNDSWTKKIPVRQKKCCEGQKNEKQERLLLSFFAQVKKSLLKGILLEIS